MTYVWHKRINDRLMDQFKQNRLAHALLFAGQRYLGKFDFAVQFAKQLLCETHTACGDCKYCHLLAAGSHPDFRLLQPEEDSKQIKIEQVRALVEWVNQTAQMSGMKIAILNPAEQMNQSSMNALLKCLEEPSNNTLLILISPRPGILIPTIRSRCQRISFSIPARADALNWLNQSLAETVDAEVLLDLAGGIPLAVVEKYGTETMARRRLIIDTWSQVMLKRLGPVDAATSLAKVDMEEVFDVSLSLFADIAMLTHGVSNNFIRNKDVEDVLVSIQGCLTPLVAQNIYVRLQRDFSLQKSTSNPNRTLLLESLFIDCGRQKLQGFAEYSL